MLGSWRQEISLDGKMTYQYQRLLFTSHILQAASRQRAMQRWPASARSVTPWDDEERTFERGKFQVLMKRGRKKCKA